MERLLKTLPVINGELFVTSAGLRLKMAEFIGEVKIYERQRQVAVLGSLQKGVKSIYASVIVCGELDYQTGAGEDLIHSGRVFDAAADVLSERVYFAGLRFADSDPINNELIFEITDLELIKKLVTA